MILIYFFQRGYLDKSRVSSLVTIRFPGVIDLSDMIYKFL